MVYVLGLNLNHNCTACLLKDGKILACASEERFSGIKNHLGFPFRAVQWVLKFAGITPQDLDLVVDSFTTPMRNFWTITQMKEYFVKKGGLGMEAWLQRYRAMGYKPAAAGLRAITFLSRHLFYSRKRHDRELSNVLGVPVEKVKSVDHHVAHAYATFFGFSRTPECLVMTYDGGGDGTCGGVFLAKKERLRRLVSIPNSCSLAALYADVTLHLGMKMIEHEYKVMGLAPYADQVGVERVYKEVFDGLFEVDSSLNIRSAFPSEYFYEYLKGKLFQKFLGERRSLYRFDWIAGAIQRLTEEVLVEWVEKAIHKTGMRNVGVGGGVFLNVKANMEIMYRTPVTHFYICPSGGDESTAIGAAYWGYKILCGENAKTVPIRDLYLGPSYSSQEVEEALRRWKLKEKGIKVEEIGDIEGEIAELLSKGKIVARFRGRMEFGARALGNRSILADPSNFDLVKELNEQIKQRDFWMPFAPTILSERQHDYLVNPKRIEAPYMVLAFRTTPLAWKELKAAIHPYDKTCRPQVLEKEWNESYYRLIKEFEKITGIGGVLNTSFNLHGEPIVCSPDDAIRTFLNSGLQYLALEDYLLSKR